MVGVVWGCLFNSGNEILVEVSLVNVVSIVVMIQGLVGLEGGVGVNYDVDMGSMFGVVVGEDGLEMGNFIFIGGLDVMKLGVVDVGGISGVVVVVGDDIVIYISGVVSLCFEVNIGNRVVCVDVDDLVVNKEFNVFLVFNEVFMYVFVGNIYCCLCQLR